MLISTQAATAATRQPLGGGGGGAGPTLTISAPNPPSGPAGTMVVVTSNGWPNGATVVISIGSSGGNCSTTTPVNGASGTANGDGTAQISFAWPALPPGTYPVCGSDASTPTQVIQSTNSFTNLSQTPPGITVPASVVGGSSVALTGVSWLPGSTPVAVFAGQPSGNGCATHLIDLTSQNDGSLSGTFTAPSVTATTVYTITAVSPRGTCGGAAAPTLHATATLTVTPAAGGTTTPTPTGHQTPTPSIHLTPTPTHTGGANPVPAPAPGGPCPPLPSAFCSSVGGGPWCLICLIPLLLLLLLILLVALFARRRNEEVVVSEEDITSQIDPDSVAPMGSLRYVRTVRETTQVVNRKTGAVRRSSVRVFDEFVDDQGNTRRRPQP